MLDFSKLFNKKDEFELEKREIEKDTTIFYLEEKRNIINKAKEVSKKYQDNIKKSEILQSEILKGIATGESIETLFIKALDTIGILTNDKAFINQSRQDIYNIQADVFENKKILEIKLIDFMDRKERLKKALKITLEEKRKININKSIKILDIEIIKTLKLLEKNK